MSTERSFRSPPARVRRPQAPGPFVVGLVGPRGSGKSRLARAPAAPHFAVLDADRMGHEIVNEDAAVRAALAAEYGADVYRADGTLDRPRVAARVFSDPEALARLNRLVHPRILARLRDGVAAATREGFTGTLVVDAALLLDWGFERECDAVLAVLAPRALQVERLRAARGWSEEEILRRLAVARGDESFVALADDVVTNDRTPAEALEAARSVIARLERRRAGA